MMGTFQDLTGRAFGRLTVLRRVGHRGEYILWRCRCECGKEKDISAATLRNGNTNSCGCLRSPPLTGQRFGRYTVGVRVQKGDGRAWYEVVCDCGTTKVIGAKHLRDGTVVSCGCLAAEQTRTRSTTHGCTRLPEYKVWSGLFDRCHNPKNKDYANYGGRGITVCDRWRLFENFLADMGPRPTTPGKWSIDRINNDGNYEPGNCRWTVTRVQCRNMRTNRIIDHNGRRLTMAGWADLLGVHQDTLYDRFRNGWAVDRALTQTFRENRRRRVPKFPPLIM